MRMMEEHGACKKNVSTLYRIGMFAQMNHVTVKALRFYEEQRLLLPAYVEEENGYRYYTMDQMAQLQQITALKQVGFTLEDIRRLQLGADRQALLNGKKAEIMKKIAELTAQLAAVDRFLSGSEEVLDAPVLVRTIPSVIVASMRSRMESYDDLFKQMPAMGAEMERLGCECALPEYCFTEYLEPGYQSENILIETCEAVTGKKENSDRIAFRTMPEIEAACIFHKGSYRDFPRSYSAVLKFIEENDYEICGNIREKYIDGVWNKESEAEWLSEIQIPVRKNGGQ